MCPGACPTSVRRSPPSVAYRARPTLTTMERHQGCPPWFPASGPRTLPRSPSSPCLFSVLWVNKWNEESDPPGNDFGTAVRQPRPAVHAQDGGGYVYPGADCVLTALGFFIAAGNTPTNEMEAQVGLWTGTCSRHAIKQRVVWTSPISAI